MLTEFLSAKPLRDEYAFRNYSAKYDSIGLLFFNIYNYVTPEQLHYEIVTEDTIEYMNNVFYWFQNAEGSRSKFWKNTIISRVELLAKISIWFSGVYINRLQFQAAVQLAINKAYIRYQTNAAVDEQVT